MAKRKQINEDLLLEIALREFSSKRYDEVSLNTIISEAGISKGSFYYRYADKYQLYICLLKKSAGVKWQYISEDLGPGLPSNLFELFRLQAEAGFRFSRRYPQYADLGKHFAEEKGSSHHARAMEELKGEQSGALDTLIEKAAGAGQFAPEFSISFLKRIIKHLFATFEDLQSADESPEATLQQMLRLLSKGTGLLHEPGCDQ